MRLAACIPWLLAAALTLAVKPAHAFDVEEVTKSAADFLKTLEPYYPHEFVQEWAADYFSAKDRAARIQLSQDYPKLFGIRLACRFTPTGKEPLAVIPGDWIESTEGGVLQCADGAEAIVRAKSKVQLQQLGREPALHAESGSYVLKLGSSRFALRTTKATVLLDGRDGRHQMEGSATGGEEVIRCNLGDVTGSLRAKEGAGHSLLESYACRMELLKGEEYHYLLGNESIQVPNLALDRAQWPRKANLATPEGVGTYVFVLAPAPGKDSRKLSWTLLVPTLSKLKCTLYNRAARFQKAASIKSFESEVAQGELSVTAEEAKGLLSAVCEGETFVVGSQAAQFRDPATAP